jgi:L-ascorbate metabolism protein UlaG (beta-lactamase superfamily)
VPAEITWVGHATVLIEIDGVRVLTDPVLGRGAGPLVRIGPPPDPSVARDIDAVLVSHLHHDHLAPRSLRRVGAPVIAPRGVGAWLRRRRLREVTELSVGESTSVGPLRVAAVTATHDNRRLHIGPTADPLGFTVEGSSSVYFAGDTDLYDEMADLSGSVDVALLPIWGWGTTLGPGHLDPERAARAAALISPRVVVPVHWGSLALPKPIRGSAGTDKPAREFVEFAARLAPEVEVRVLAPGGRTLVD